MSCERDPTVPRRYGPLIETGMSLREIRKHTSYEIMVMLKALERKRIIDEGAKLMSMSDKERSNIIRNNPNAMELRQYYEGEMYLFRLWRERVGAKDDADTDDG